jgi:uncharacterized protein (DUF3084 family)
LSTLTKLFVILLVVLSLLLTAATVVFVSQVENYKATADTMQARLAAATSERDRARADMDAVQASAQEAVKQASTQVEQAKQNMNSLQQMLVDRDTQLGQSKSQAAIQAADLTRLAEGLKASEDTKSQLQQQLADLRGANDKFLTQNAQLNQSVTDLTNRLEVTERERKFLAEQLAEAKNQNEKQAGMLRDAGISPQFASARGMRAGAPAINGVIRNVRPIAGIPYATISVGSADGVAKGMEFKIVDRDSGQFMGLLTVDSVELNEATGRLTGEPQKVAQIRQGAEVKTQL